MNRIRIPKSNCSWSIGEDHRFRTTRIEAVFRMPDGESLHNAIQVADDLLRNPHYSDRLIDGMLREMSYEVGRKMLGVER